MHMAEQNSLIGSSSLLLPLPTLNFLSLTAEINRCSLGEFSMENQTVHDANVNDSDNVNSHAEPEEISESFLCCICLDLLYKPIVLSCGHISCFWCVHRSMNSLHESRCPICRCTYSHFPAICVMLHHLLMKMYPIGYKMREKQILEEEKRMGFFSPQLDSHACEPLVDNEFGHLGDSMDSFTTVCESTSKGDTHENMKQLESVSLVLNNGTTIPKQSSMRVEPVMEKNFSANKLNGDCKKISIADALCTGCKQLLIHPAVLNCGHAYCETCVIRSTDEQLRCEVCQCLNPNGFPKVCLELDHFLEEQFCKEYALRKAAVELKTVHLKHESPTTCSKEAGKLRFISSLVLTMEHSLLCPRSKVHIGVGCDSCGMFPIIGDRYQCKDCVEAIGFDLCGDCYNTRSKLPGRFNQQHTPEHRLELVKRFVSGRIEDGSSTALVLANHVLENGSPVTSPNDSQESAGNALISTITNSDHSIDQNNTESTS